jgi:hypothetical protein
MKVVHASKHQRGSVAEFASYEAPCGSIIEREGAFVRRDGNGRSDGTNVLDSSCLEL